MKGNRRGHICTQRSTTLGWKQGLPNGGVTAKYPNHQQRDAGFGIDVLRIKLRRALPQAQPKPLARQAEQPAVGTVAPLQKRQPRMQHQPVCNPTDRPSEHHLQEQSRYTLSAHEHTHTEYTFHTHMPQERRKKLCVQVAPLLRPYKCKSNISSETAGN